MEQTVYTVEVSSAIVQIPYTQFYVSFSTYGAYVAGVYYAYLHKPDLFEEYAAKRSFERAAGLLNIPDHFAKPELLFHFEEGWPVVKIKSFEEKDKWHTIKKFPYIKKGDDVWPILERTNYFSDNCERSVFSKQRPNLDLHKHTFYAINLFTDKDKMHDFGVSVTSPRMKETVGKMVDHIGREYPKKYKVMPPEYEMNRRFSQQKEKSIKRMILRDFVSGSKN